jgi:chemotaxis protein methyltransferase CheR
LTPDDLAFLDALLKARCGLRLRADKGYFAEGRLAPLARREGLETVADLVERMRQDPDAAVTAAAAEALSVTDTAFFRDSAVFDHIGRTLLPALATGGAPIRAWCAGCSTGQEAYSLAMLAEQHGPALGVEIVATDLSERVLEKAHAGLYTQFEVQRGLPIRLLLKHFEKSGDMWAISPRLRARIRWRRLNLMEARRSVRPFDLILCRHLLSHFEPEARDRVMAQLTASLAPGGYLVLGPDDPAPAGFAAAGAPGVFRHGQAEGQQAA